MKVKTTANIEIKKINRTRIFNIFLEGKDLTRQDLVQRLNLSLPTVTQNMNQLMEENLIIESGSIGNTGGKRAKTYSLNKLARVSLGLDITRHRISVVMVDLSGNIIQHMKIRHDFEHNDQYYKKLGEIVDSMIKTSDISRSRILGVGFGVPGLVSKDGKTVALGSALNFTGTTIDEFSKYVDFDSVFFNDANAASYAENWMGHMNTSAFYIMLSNNIGGSVLINGVVYQGDHIRSGEVGHTLVVPNGRKCYCGKYGCVDPYCSATVLSDLTNGDLELFFTNLENGDEEAVQAWEEYTDHLSTALNNVRALFDCDIILGGYVGTYIEKFIDKLKKKTIEKCTFDNNADFLKVCKYKVESIASGAALPFIKDFLDRV